MGVYQLCKQEQPLGRSHIIPAAFFRTALREDDEHLLLVTDRVDTPYQKRLRNGVYDTNILCHACERRFATVDDYASKVLLQTDITAFRPLQGRGQVVAYQTDGIDQKLLLRFLVATLWRASVSTHEFYRRVKLGPKFERAAAKVVESYDQPIPEMFGAVLSIWLSKGESPVEVKPIMDPFAERIDGVRTYRIYLDRFVAYVKADQRPFQSPFAEAGLCASPTLTVFARELSESKDLAALKRVTVRAHQNRQRMKPASSVPKGRP